MTSNGWAHSGSTFNGGDAKVAVTTLWPIGGSLYVCNRNYDKAQTISNHTTKAWNLLVPNWVRVCWRLDQSHFLSSSWHEYASHRSHDSVGQPLTNETYSHQTVWINTFFRSTVGRHWHHKGWRSTSHTSINSHTKSSADVQGGDLIWVNASWPESEAPSVLVWGRSSDANQVGKMSKFVIWNVLRVEEPWPCLTDPQSERFTSKAKTVRQRIKVD